MTSVAQTLLNEHALYGSWGAVAKRRKVSKIMAWRVALEGYEPKNLVIRRRLGFPVPIEPRQCLARRKCDGAIFDPNVPWRWSCYDCSPMRRRP